MGIVEGDQKALKMWEGDSEETHLGSHLVLTTGHWIVANE